MRKLRSLLKKVWLHGIRHFRGGVACARAQGVEVGEHCRLYTYNFGSEPFLVKIGNNTTITGGVAIITHDGSGSLVRDRKGRRFRYARVEIGSNCFIGVGSIILPGVRIGNNVIIGAGSVVTKSIPDGSVVAGVPARVVGSFADFESKALNSWVSEEDLSGEGDYRSRILKVVESSFRPDIPKHNQPLCGDC
jgi:acetyltransferase-like isoleucine patch superfamily enzyme